MTDLTFSLGGDISAFEKAMLNAVVAGKGASDKLTTYFEQASKKVDDAFDFKIENLIKADTILKGLKIAGGLFAGFEAAKEAVTLLKEAVEAATKELEHLVSIGDRAHAIGSGTSFFQAYIGDFKALGLTAEQAEASLSHARDALQTNIREGGKGTAYTSDAADRVEQNVKAGNLPAGSDQQLAGATTYEAKLRVILDLVDQLQAKGASIASFDLAGKVFGPEVENSLRQGVTTTQQIRDNLDGISNTGETRKHSEAEIAAALKIDADLTDQNKRLAEQWFGWDEQISLIQLDILQSCVNVRELYVEIVEKVDGWVKSLNSVFSTLGDIANWSGFAKFDNLLKTYNLISGGIVLKGEPGFDLDRPLNALGGGQKLPALGPVPPTRPVDTSRRLPSLNEGAGGREAGSKAADPVAELIKSLEKTAAAERGEAAALGQSNKAKQELIDLAKAEEIARERGKALTDAERRSVMAAADAYSEAKKKVDDFAKAQETLKQGMDEVRDAAKGALSTLVEDLRNGAGFGKAFGDVLAGIESKLFDLAENSVIDSLLGKSGTLGTGTGTGAGSGLLAALVSGFGGAKGGGFQGWFGLAEGGPVRRYASGGQISGPGGPRSDAIPIMASDGEYIVNARATADNRHLLDAINSGGAVIRRAQGGLVGRSSAAMGGGDGAAPVVNVYNAHAGAQVSAKPGPMQDGRRTIQVMVEDALVHSAANNGRGYQAIAKRSGAGRSGF